ncbi:hypothetical protein B0H14DRAFT_3779775 [Mycena olivaceomarginata]|nr:hypothetical protein B0H14DRAFT_3779775 [Mycena olivaceomarginata]
MALDAVCAVEQLRHKYLQDPLQHAFNLKAAEDDFSITGDDLAATLTVLRQMDEELAFRPESWTILFAEHEDVLAVVEREWRDEVEEARAEAKELRHGASPSAKISASPSPTSRPTLDGLHSKFEAALAHLKEKSEAKDAETEAYGKTIDKLSEYFKRTPHERRLGSPTRRRGLQARVPRSTLPNHITHTLV